MPKENVVVAGALGLVLIGCDCCTGVWGVKVQPVISCCS